MKIGICGYGNLGKAVEKKVLQKGEDEIAGIFTRRDGVISESGASVYPYDKAGEFEGKIDVMVMCGGSQEDLIVQSPEMLKHFDIIDTFDTHARIEEHKKNLIKAHEKYGHSAIYSCGWDPGLFSIARVIFENVFDCKAQTFWGKGVSQGHSEALRNIPGVSDAIQFTVPNEEVLNKTLKGGYVPKDDEKHIRECYISLDGSRSFEEIKKQILATENYFKGQKVIVHECGDLKVKELRKHMYHKGVVIGGDGEAQMILNAKMESNPLFTAQIVLAFAHTLEKMPKGVYSVLDVPIGLIGGKDNKKLL